MKGGGREGGMTCPECKKTMQWQEGLLVDGVRDMAIGKHYCLKCNIFSKSKESKGIRKGKKLAHGLIGVHAMSKKITQHSVATQIGILRERQHCAICKNNIYEPCMCTDCNCLYCREYKI